MAAVRRHGKSSQIAADKIAKRQPKNDRRLTSGKHSLVASCTIVLSMFLFWHEHCILTLVLVLYCCHAQYDSNAM